MVDDALFSSARKDWGTPKWLFDDLNKRYNFTVDAAASPHNAKCEKFFSEEGENGLIASWQNHCVFVNPPYGRDITGLWVRKCLEEYNKGACLICALLPVRTDTRWFHDYIVNKKGVRIEFIKGRLKFEGAKHSAPFPSMLVKYVLWW